MHYASQITAKLEFACDPFPFSPAHTSIYKHSSIFKSLTKCHIHAQREHRPNCCSMYYNTIYLTLSPALDAFPGLVDAGYHGVLQRLDEPLHCKAYYAVLEKLSSPLFSESLCRRKVLNKSLSVPQVSLPLLPDDYPRGALWGVQDGASYRISSKYIIWM